MLKRLISALPPYPYAVFYLGFLFAVALLTWLVAGEAAVGAGMVAFGLLFPGLIAVAESMFPMNARVPNPVHEVQLLDYRLRLRDASAILDDEQTPEAAKLEAQNEMREVAHQLIALVEHLEPSLRRTDARPSSEPSGAGDPIIL